MTGGASLPRPIGGGGPAGQFLTVRDQLACSIDSNVPLPSLEALAGPFPAYATETQKQAWRARAEAAYRYHRADAMMEARAL